MLARKEVQIPLYDLISCLSDIIDLINPDLVNHHQKVAYIAYRLGTELGLPSRETSDLLLAGKLHDIGILSSSERIKSMQFETASANAHAEVGYRLLVAFAPLAGVARLIRHHHVGWDEAGSERKGNVLHGSQLLHLADRVAVLTVHCNGNLLSHGRSILDTVKAQRGSMFMPEAVDALERLAEKEFFWLDLCSSGIGSLLRQRVVKESIGINLTSLLDLARIFSRIIDFRSRFTATHSSGVAASAEALARLIGFSERECTMMKVAGFLHDLGKLAVPTEVLEKPGPLSPQERDLIRCHTFHTYRTLENIGDFALINAWASFHHECLDGSGYPFHLTREELSLGSRIMAVADVFTAITEDRPYRRGMESEQALATIGEMVARQALDPLVVEVLRANFALINTVRMEAQAASIREYSQLQRYLAEPVPPPVHEGARRPLPTAG